MPAAPIRTLDLFAGAGGLTQGLHSASKRFTTIAAVEIDRAAAASFNATFGAGLAVAKPIERWLEEDPMPGGIDVIVGGPPCQGFSTLGKQAADDVRNSLWQKYAETIVLTQPKYFVIENVAAFAKSSEFRDFEAAIDGGILSGYGFRHAVVNAADYGAPQVRKRAIVIGYRLDVGFPGFPEPTHIKAHVTVRDVLGSFPRGTMAIDLPDSRFVEDADGSMPGAFCPPELHLGRGYTATSLKRFGHIPEGGNRFSLPDELKAACWLNHTSGSSDVMGRMHWDRPSVTIRTEFFKPEKGRYLHPTEDRAITHYEAARLQGFPDSHRFVGSKTAIARQIGNAVPIQLGAALGRTLEAAL